MAKKSLMALIIGTLIAGGAFAQTTYQAMAKNTITVDVGPTIVGAVIGSVGKIIGDDSGISSSGFGIGAQYERQIFRHMSVAGRFAYLGGGLGYTETENNLDASLEMKFSSFSIEGHARYYPFGETFFLDGMLGYGNLSMNFSGSVYAEEGGQKTRESVSFTALRSYVKLGAKLGWRISFGKKGGFTFEPALGYYGGIGLGDSFGKQLSSELDEGDIDNDLDAMFQILENFIFIGGPRVSLSFGWRF